MVIFTHNRTLYVNPKIPDSNEKKKMKKDGYMSVFLNHFQSISVHLTAFSITSSPLLFSPPLCIS